jgi:hypothetical protein
MVDAQTPAPLHLHSCPWVFECLAIPDATPCGTTTRPDIGNLSPHRNHNHQASPATPFIHQPPQHIHHLSILHPNFHVRASARLPSSTNSIFVFPTAVRRFDSRRFPHNQASSSSQTSPAFRPSVVCVHHSTSARLRPSRAYQILPIGK